MAFVAWSSLGQIEGLPFFEVGGNAGVMNDFLQRPGRYWRGMNDFLYEGNNAHHSDLRFLWCLGCPGIEKSFIPPKFPLCICENRSYPPSFRHPFASPQRPDSRRPGPCGLVPNGLVPAAWSLRGWIFAGWVLLESLQRTSSRPARRRPKRRCPALESPGRRRRR